MIRCMFIIFFKPNEVKSSVCVYEHMCLSDRSAVFTNAAVRCHTDSCHRQTINEWLLLYINKPWMCVLFQIQALCYSKCYDCLFSFLLSICLYVNIFMVTDECIVMHPCNFVWAAGSMSKTSEAEFQTEKPHCIYIVIVRSIELLNVPGYCPFSAKCESVRMQEGGFS